jgi:hypothetical protein
MVFLIFLLVLVFCLYGAWGLLGQTPAHRTGWPAIWRLASVIAVLRISALWVGVVGLRRSDWLQGPAYLILMLTLPDIYIVKVVRTNPLRWAILGSLTLVVTSFLWSIAFLWVANRFWSKPSAFDVTND